VSIDQDVARLDAGLQRLVRTLDGLPSEALYTPPADGEWPVMSTLAHVAEMLPYWAHQGALIAATPGRPFGRTHDDPGRLGAIDEHGHDALAVIGPMLHASLAEAIGVLRTLPDGALAATGQHPARGTMSVQNIIDSFMTGHLDDHVNQIQTALQQLGYSPSQVP
jgi:uncharacterized damage-inducible protein DinB